MNIKNYILIPGFLIFISFPLINSFVRIMPDSKSNENRHLKPFPQLDIRIIDKIPKDIEDYLTDHISVRNHMIRLYNKLNIFVFRSSPVSIKAFIGKDGWCYFSGEELKTFTGTDLFTEQELKDFKNELIDRKKIIESLNAKLFIAIVPNKANIYPEHMPDHIIKANTVGYGQQMLNYLKQNKLPVIDLYQPLTEAKSINEIYYKTDNHWNDLGAFIASNEILKSFSTINSTIRPLSLDTYEVKKTKENPGDIAKMLTMEDETIEYNYVPTRKNGFKSYQKNLGKYKCIEGFAYPWDYEYTRYTANDSLPSVLIIRDSFGTKIFPYVSEQCRKCTMIFDAWHYGLNENIIKGERPDIVLFLILESQLKNLMKYKNATKNN